MQIHMTDFVVRVRERGVVTIPEEIRKVDDISPGDYIVLRIVKKADYKDILANGDASKKVE